MAKSVTCAVYASRILKAQVQCVKIASVRHYPRWTHRRPAYIVENTYSQDEKERWKLNVEREIVRDSRNQKHNLETNLSPRSGSYQERVDFKNQESYSHTLLKESFVDVAHKTEQCVTESVKFSENESKSTNQKQIYSEDSSKERKFGGSVSDGSNVECFSPKSSKEPRKHKEQKTLKKVKIFSEKEVEKMVKMRESAQKLGVPIFTDLGTDDTVLSQYVTNVKSKKKREKKHKILLEGKRLISDALDAGVLPEVVFFSRIKDLKDLNLPDGVKIFKITYKKLSLWSEVATSQGVLAILNTPNVSKKRPASLPLTVICDNVRDPGNLGTILRSCAGVGCRKVVLTKGCVDLWDPRVLRAGAGAHFRLSISQAANWDDLSVEMNKNSYVCIAENKVVQHFLCQQKGKSDVDGEIESDKDDDDDDDDGDDDIVLQRSECSDQNPEINVVPVVPYYALNYASLPSVVLIVGGETEGISSEAYEYVSKTSGVRVNIPLSNNVDSLNCGTALSIIAFEMKKQFLVKGNASEPEMKEHTDNSQNSKASIMN